MENQGTKYLNVKIDIEGTEKEWKIALEDGKHRIEEKAVKTGLKKDAGEDITATLFLTYQYNQEEQEIILCSSEYESEDATCLSLYNGASDEISLIYAYQTEAEVMGAADSGREELYRTLHRYIRTINKKIYDAACEVDLRILLRTPCPVELKDADWNGSSFQSSWGGEVTFRYNEAFANVIGSCYDQKIAGLSWINLWENQFGHAQCCASHNQLQFHCSNQLDGGHVVSGQNALRVPYGSNNVYIMPICHSHNMDDTVYMLAHHYRRGIWLVNYHNP